jgi:hypothetical protein
MTEISFFLSRSYYRRLPEKEEKKTGYRQSLAIDMYCLDVFLINIDGIGVGSMVHHSLALFSY